MSLSVSALWRPQALLEQAGIDHLFEFCICAEDVLHHKPSPEPYLKAAGMMGISPSRCRWCFFSSSTGTNTSSEISQTRPNHPSDQTQVKYTSIHRCISRPCVNNPRTSAFSEGAWRYLHERP